MKISIVTVAFNEEKNIRRTIESVLNQTSCDFEYIICDGKSTDRTVEIAKEYESIFSQKGINFIVNSEKDNGIYDGMNKGIDLSSGNYVIFINAGDALYNSDVIGNIIRSIKDDQPEVVYGDCQFIDNHIKRVECADHQLLKERMSICHQSVLVRTDIIKANKFDINYKIAADYNMMLTLYMQKCRFFKINEVISIFYADGISSLQIIESTKEACAVKLRHGIKCNARKEISIAKKIQRIIKIKNYLPKIIWKIWSVNIKKREWIE